jgi:hypothetical protein
MISNVDPGLSISAVGLSIASKLTKLSDKLRGPAPLNSARVTGMAAVPVWQNCQDHGQVGDPATASSGQPLPAPAAPSGHYQNIDIEDWDIMFSAVRIRLMRTMNQRLGELPNVPKHSAELSASLIQAVVLDCVIELDKLHAALKQERSQRLTP